MRFRVGVLAAGAIAAVGIGAGITALAVVAPACSDNAGAVNTTGSAPGAPCGSGATITIDAPSNCRNNATLPGCFMCVRIANDAGAPGVCEVPCRIGMTDCPAGQTCVGTLVPPAYGATWSGCSSYGTDVSGTVGYCQ